MRTEVVEDVSALTALREEWNELLADSPADGLFLTWEWLHTWWTHLAAKRTLAVVTVRDNARLIGIAPLCRRQADPRRPMPFTSLEFLGSGTAGSDYLDIIVRRGREAEAVEALAESIRSFDQPLELNQLAAGSSTGMLVEKLSEASWTVEQANTNVCPYIPLNGCSWDDYLASLGSEHRYGFQRKMKKLAKEAGPNPGDLLFHRAEDEAQREEALRVLIELHEKRWRDRGEASDAFHTAEHVAFHNDFTRLALCAGWLRLYLLLVAGRPLSAFYGFRYGRKFYFFQSGFDPDCARLSLGLVTMGMAIRTAIEEGAAEYDLLHGAEEYKFHWASQTRDLFRIQLFPAGFRGLLLQHAVGVTRSARRLAKQVLRKG